MKVVHIVLPLLMLAAHCFAVPASNETFFLKQPDGSTIEVRYVGDENFHALVSADDYILQKDALGYSKKDSLRVFMSAMHKTAVQRT